MQSSVRLAAKEFLASACSKTAPRGQEKPGRQDPGHLSVRDRGRQGLARVTSDSRAAERVVETVVGNRLASNSAFILNPWPARVWKVPNQGV